MISDGKGGGRVKIEFPEYVLRILGAYENAGYEAYALSAGACEIRFSDAHRMIGISRRLPARRRRCGSSTPPDFSVKALSGLKHGTVSVVGEKRRRKRRFLRGNGVSSATGNIPICADPTR